jgi:hypothetical protein
MPSFLIFRVVPATAATQTLSIAHKNIFYVLKVRSQQIRRGLVLTVSIGKAARKKTSAAQHGQEASEQVRLDVPVLRSVSLTNPITADATKMVVAM